MRHNLLQGDSGGPLTYESGDQHILIGETSFVPYPCGQVSAFTFYEIFKVIKYIQANKYALYGRISYFRTWLESKMTSPTFCSGGPNTDTKNRRRKNKRKIKRKNALGIKDSKN